MYTRNYVVRAVYIIRRHHRCFAIDFHFETTQFQFVKNKALSNALFYMSATRPQPMASGYWYALQIYEEILCVDDILRDFLKTVIEPTNFPLIALVYV